MNTITVKASKDYNVLIGSGLQAQTGALARSLKKSGKAVIISDTDVWPLYGEQVAKSLTDAGFVCSNFVFPAGEASKCADTYLSILNYLALQHITRSDILIALGGGVVGDMTGFVAATYLRGISYIQVPTTLLAMVDSSVGGKTAIDLPAGKNLVGAFYQPSLVICDIDSLRTLPDSIFRDGCAEVIKYGILYDPALFAHLQENGLGFDREAVVSRCIELKRDVVADDEFDRGARQKLNLGHTIGHSIEADSNFTISHGQAVAMGMVIVSKAGYATGICDEETYNQVLKIVKQFGLPYKTLCSAQTIYNYALSDKKRSGSTVNLIVPRKIGDCIIQPTAVEKLLSFIEAGL